MSDKIKIILIAFIIAIVAPASIIGPVVAQSGIDGSNLVIGDITAPSEVTSGEEVTIESSAEIPDLPADWHANLDFILYVDGSQVGTQEVSLTDGESADVAIQHQFQGSGVKEVYLEVNGELTREGRVSDQSTSIDRTTRTVSVDVTERIGTSVSDQGAAFTTPDSIQSEVDEVRENIPDVVTENAVSHAFVLASSDQLYLVFTATEPQEGYASVDGTSYNLRDITINGNQNTLDIQPVVAESVEFKDPSEVSVEEVYENTQEYDRQYVEINANHRSVSIDYENSTYSATAGVLVDEALAPEELFGSAGERSRAILSELDGDNIGSALGDISRPHVVTASSETEYWDNTPVTMSGIIADPNSPAGRFIQAHQEDNILPTDSNTPILYTIDKVYDAQSVSDISEVSAKPAAYDGETVRFEANLYMNTISTKRVVESATGNKLPPVDTILHGGVGWEQLPESRDDLIGIVAASSIEQKQLSETRRGRYVVIGEVVSTDRIKGDLPRGSVLIAYELERVGSVETASGEDLVEQQSLAVSNVLKQQANPEIDASVSSAETGEKSSEDTVDDTTESTGDADTESTEDTQSESNREEPDSTQNGGIIRTIIDLISRLFEEL